MHPRRAIPHPRSLLLLAVLGLLVGCGAEGPAASSAGAPPLDADRGDAASPGTVSGDVDPLLGARLGDDLLLEESLLDESLLGDTDLDASLFDDPAADTAPTGAESITPSSGEPGHVHVAGPNGGAIVTLGEHHAHLEYAHNEHWGIASVYLYDAEMNDREFDVPPTINVRCEDESISITPGRENFDEVEDGGWHFEDDALLGVPEAGRFRLLIDGRTYTPVFEHVHVGHGAHAAPHATGPHVHGAGPKGGYVVNLGHHHVHVEVVHNANWGLVATYVYDAAMEPRTFDEVPVLNVKMDDVPLQLVAVRENWDGEEDGGWHFEDDALLGVPDGGRFRVVVDGKTHVVELLYFAHGEEPGHAHGHAADDHSQCDPAICDLAPSGGN